MATQYYNQPQISINDQIQLLKSEGLIINDEGKAFHSPPCLKKLQKVGVDVWLYRIKVLVLLQNNSDDYGTYCF